MHGSFALLDAGATRNLKGIARDASPRTGWRNSLQLYAGNWLTRGPSTALLSLRDSNSAQDDSVKECSGNLTYSVELSGIGFVQVGLDGVSLARHLEFGEKGEGLLELLPLG